MVLLERRREIYVASRICERMARGWSEAGAVLSLRVTRWMARARAARVVMPVRTKMSSHRHRWAGVAVAEPW